LSFFQNREILSILEKTQIAKIELVGQQKGMFIIPNIPLHTS
jgi:hypothetical protein